MLVEAIADLLQINGKVHCVFLTSPFKLFEHGLHILPKHGSRIVTNVVLEKWKLRRQYDDQPSL
jgi:hypothetical protein